MSRGYEKRYQRCFFAALDLALDDHTIKVIVKEECEPGTQGHYCSIDYLEVISPDCPPEHRMIINYDYNYSRMVYGNYVRDRVVLQPGKWYQSRPTKFSYPMTMYEEHEPADIWSVHYSNLSADLAKKCDNPGVGYSEGYDQPVLHDEYVHVPCYNRTELRRDPNVRNFWGSSIKQFRDKIWNTKGALGGAIWAGIDETNIFTGGHTRLAWGIIDIRRR